MHIPHSSLTSQITGLISESIPFSLLDIKLPLNCNSYSSWFLAPPFSIWFTPFIVIWFSCMFSLIRLELLHSPSPISFAFLSDSSHPIISSVFKQALFNYSNLYKSPLLSSSCFNEVIWHLTIDNLLRFPSLRIVLNILNDGNLQFSKYAQQGFSFVIMLIVSGDS